jgi:flavin reductase (DIM6/NTAB) family NADH-FMN oxidoreductase RutF
VSSACSVSREPPLVLVCIDRLAQSCVTIAASGFYALNIVTRGQMFLADRFAGRGPVIDPAFGGVQYHIAATGAPILEGALAWMDCRVWATYDGGDHVIFVGHVEAAGLGTGADPLVYFDRRYLRVM